MDEVPRQQKDCAVRLCLLRQSAHDLRESIVEIRVLDAMVAEYAYNLSMLKKNYEI